MHLGSSLIAIAIFAFTCGQTALSGIRPPEERLQPFIVATSDYDPYTTTLFAVLDDQGNLAGLYYKADDPNNAEGIFSLAEIRKGVVFRKDIASGNEVIRFASQDIIAKDGGTVNIDYLKNGIWGTRDNFSMQVHQVGAIWTAYTDPDQGSKPFTKMKFFQNTFFGKIVGISEIKVE